MVYHGHTVSTTPGVAVPLYTQHFKAAWITIYPRSTNNGEVRIGGQPTASDNVALNGVTTAIPAGTGMPLNVGDSGVLWMMSGPNPIDIATIYFDVDSSGDGVQFVYGRP